MFKVVLVVFLLALAGPGRAEIARELVGRYQMEMQASEILDLRSDGTATLSGETMRWSTKGQVLTLGSDVMPYSMQGDRLTVMFGPLPLTWKRVSGPPAPVPAERANRKAPGQDPAPAGDAQDAQAIRVLTANPWCSFTYNKVSGTSTTRKVWFRPDGVLTMNGGAETYSSGYGGTYAGQSSNASTMLWKFQNMRLYVDDRSGAGYQDIGLTSTTNSNGSIILKAQGREYAVCR